MIDIAYTPDQIRAWATAKRPSLITAEPGEWEAYSDTQLALDKAAIEALHTIAAWRDAADEDTLSDSATRFYNGLGERVWGLEDSSLLWMARNASPENCPRRVLKAVVGFWSDCTRWAKDCEHLLGLSIRTLAEL